MSFLEICGRRNPSGYRLGLLGKEMDGLSSGVVSKFMATLTEVCAAAA
jgi:hypothetical protein